MTEEEALAICHLNLTGTKHKDLMLTARALSYLRSLPKYGSNKKVGEATGVSREIVREFLTLLRLPERVQVLLDRNVLGLEHGRKLEQFNSRYPDRINEAVDAVVDMSAIDARNFIDYLLRNPQLSAQEAKKIVLESKTTIEQEYHVVAILSEEYFKQLSTVAAIQKKPVDELVTTVVIKWLDKGATVD